MAQQPQTTGLIGGVEKRRIVIVDYDEDWPRQFEVHAERIAGALGKSALKIEHFGSTSVPGLAAKPIVDILVVVQDSTNESTYLPQLEAAGYILRVREPEWNEHRMFRTPERHVQRRGARVSRRAHALRRSSGRDPRALRHRQAGATRVAFPIPRRAPGAISRARGKRIRVLERIRDR